MPLVPVARAARVDVRIVRWSPPWVAIEADFLAVDHVSDENDADERHSYYRIRVGDAAAPVTPIAAVTEPSPGEVARNPKELVR